MPSMFDATLPFVYSVDQTIMGGRAAHVLVFQDQDGQRVNVTPDVARSLASIGAVGQFLGNLAVTNTVRLIAMADHPPCMSDADNVFERSLSSTLSRCTHAMGSSFRGILRDDTAHEGLSSMTSDIEAALNESALTNAARRSIRPR